MDGEYLRAVQAAGWMIVAVETDSVWIGCPRAGCNLKTRLKSGGHIPAVCRTDPPLPEIPVVGYLNDARPALRERRQQLGLTIRDTEDVSGIADDHLAKMEKDDPSKIPNILTFVDWAASMGYDVVLRPSVLPPVTIARIVETREALERRKAHFRHFGRVRKGRAVAALPKP